MNLHPMLVHFPIALFTIYAVCELMPSKRLRQSSTWLSIKATMVIVGTGSSFATFLSGYAIKDGFMRDKTLARIVVTHAQFALLTILIFLVLAKMYAILCLEKTALQVKLSRWSLWNKLVRCAHFCYDKKIAPLFALIGLACVTVTAAIGGGIVYGQDVDPFVLFIYRILKL